MADISRNMRLFSNMVPLDTKPLPQPFKQFAYLRKSPLISLVTPMQLEAHGNATNTHNKSELTYRNAIAGLTWYEPFDDNTDGFEDDAVMRQDYIVKACEALSASFVNADDKNRLVQFQLTTKMYETMNDHIYLNVELLPSNLQESKNIDNEIRGISGIQTNENHSDKKLRSLQSMSCQPLLPTNHKSSFVECNSIHFSEGSQHSNFFPNNSSSKSELNAAFEHDAILELSTTLVRPSKPKVRKRFRFDDIKFVLKPAHDSLSADSAEFDDFRNTFRRSFVQSGFSGTPRTTWAICTAQNQRNELSLSEKKNASLYLPHRSLNYQLHNMSCLKNVFSDITCLSAEQLRALTVLTINENDIESGFDLNLVASALTEQKITRPQQQWQQLQGTDTIPATSKYARYIQIHKKEHYVQTIDTGAAAAIVEKVYHSLPALDLIVPLYLPAKTQEERANMHRWPLRIESIVATSNTESSDAAENTQSILPFASAWPSVFAMNRMRIRVFDPSKDYSIQSQHAEGPDSINKYIPKRIQELSLAHGRFSLFEYVEQCPLLRSQVGMGAKLITYYKKMNESDNYEPEPKFDDEDQEFDVLGEVAVLQPDENGPFLAKIKPGISGIVNAINTNLSIALVRKHSMHNIFLLVRRESEWVIRPFSTTFVVGQLEPRRQVPMPGRGLATELETRIINGFAYRQFLHGRLSRARLSRLCSKNLGRDLFGHGPAVQLFETLMKKVAREIDDGHFELLASDDPPTDERVEAMCSPEDICVYNAMLRGQSRLQMFGITRFVDDKLLIPVVKELPMASLFEQVAHWILKQLQLSPWTLSKGFLDVVKNGKGTLQLFGRGNPLPHRVGYSYLAVNSQRQKRTEEQHYIASVEPVKKTGTEADMRKLLKLQLRAGLLEYGYREDQIARLSRWDQVRALAEATTEALKKGEVKHQQFVRSTRETASQLNAKYKKNIQQIFEAQLEFLKNTGRPDYGKEVKDDTYLPGKTSTIVRKPENNQQRSAHVARIQEEREYKSLKQQLSRSASMLTVTGTETPGGTAADTPGLTVRSSSPAANVSKRLVKKYLIRKTVYKLLKDGNEHVEEETITADSEVELLRAKHQLEVGQRKIVKQAVVPRQPPRIVVDTPIKPSKRSAEKTNDDTAQKRTKITASAVAPDTSSKSKALKSSQRGKGNNRQRSNINAERSHAPATKKVKREHHSEFDELAGEADLEARFPLPKISIRNKRRHPKAHLNRALENVVNNLMHRPEAIDFLAPVDANRYPLYKKIVSRPMDLGMIKMKCKNNDYDNSSDFLMDVKQIVTNSELFNSKLHAITDRAAFIHESASRLVRSIPSLQQLEAESQLAMLLEHLEAALDAMSCVEGAYILAAPVSDVTVPGYSTVVKHPMSMDVMRNKVKNATYRAPSEFLDDCQQMLTNSELFNGCEHWATVVTRNVLNAARHALSIIYTDEQLRARPIVIADESKPQSGEPTEASLPLSDSTALRLSKPVADGQIVKLETSNPSISTGSNILKLHGRRSTSSIGTNAPPPVLTTSSSTGSVVTPSSVSIPSPGTLDVQGCI